MENWTHPMDILQKRSPEVFSKELLAPGHSRLSVAH